MMENLENLERQILEYCEKHNVTDILVSMALSASIQSLKSFRPIVNNDSEMKGIFKFGSINNINLLADPYLKHDCMNIYFGDKGGYFAIEGLEIKDVY